jgi:hypothetical protein
MKGLAPTRLARAGAAAGLLAGAIAESIYALHCPEMAAPFLAVFYVGAMSIPVLVGLVAAPVALVADRQRATVGAVAALPCVFIASWRRVCAVASLARLPATISVIQLTRIVVYAWREAGCVSPWSALSSTRYVSDRAFANASR